MASAKEIQGLLEKQAERIESSIDKKINDVSKAFKEEIKESNAALKKELIELMDAKIAEQMSGMDISPSPGVGAVTPGSSDQMLRELSSLKDKITFIENRSNASTAPSEGLNSNGPAKRAKRGIEEGPSIAGSSNDNTIKYRPKDPAMLLFSGKDAIKKAEAILAIAAEAAKKGIAKEDISVKGPGIGSNFTVKFKDKSSGYSTGKDAAEAVKNQYKKGENKFDNIIVARGDGQQVEYSFSWDKSSTQSLRDSVLQVIWKEIRDAPKPDDLNGDFEKYKNDGKIMFKYNVVVRVNVGVDGRYRLVWGSIEPLSKIGLSKCALEALVADRFTNFSG